jgi:Replication-relaxation
MTDALTWRRAAREAARLCPADEETLELIGRLPLVPIRQLVPLSGGRSGRSVYACVERLAERGLVSAIPGPADLGRTHRRLLLISNLGLAVLAWRREVDPASLARAWRLGRTPLRVLVGQLPALLSMYALLGLLAATGRGRARLRQWSRPGRWRPHVDGAGPARSVTLPAYAALGWEEAGSAYVEGTYLLVADTGALTPVALRRQLAGLARLDGTTPYAVPTVVIATTSERRVRAWTVLLDSVTSSRRYASRLQVEVATWESWTARAGIDPPKSRLHPDRADADNVPSAALPRSDFERECRPWVCVPRPINPSHIAAAIGEWSLAPRDRIVLDILGRHPFLADGALADVLGRTVGWARARRAELVRRGLARVVDPDELRSPLQGRRELVEVTVEGLRMLAGYVGLSLAAAVRHHGLTGGGPQTPVGPRRALLANLAHTLGADAVFAAIARVARTRRDGALVEWRNAAACAHGRMRPDGYGLLRLGRREYGFFLEFDRGTVRPAALRAKFASYHRYSVSARAARDYDGLPTILVVTTGEGAEARLAEAVCAAGFGQSRPLPLLLTSIGRIATNALGALGPIWRKGETGRRRNWPAY